METYGCLQNLVVGISPTGCLSTQPYCIQHPFPRERGLQTAEQATGIALGAEMD